VYGAAGIVGEVLDISGAAKLLRAQIDPRTPGEPVPGPVGKAAVSGEESHAAAAGRRGRRR
jgi:hypothetical protein